MKKFTVIGYRPDGSTWEGQVEAKNLDGAYTAALFAMPENFDDWTVREAAR